MRRVKQYLEMAFLSLPEGLNVLRYSLILWLAVKQVGDYSWLVPEP